jgi:indolepyruvate ferredoxin oxidoreductase alpha subunit
VAYVGGYQGAPVSHVMDVLNDARGILDELGVHVETNANEAGAAAMLGASINYPMRGAVAFKSTVGTNVASDALSNLASAGVKGGALLVLGEDYGEGSSIIQERTHAFAMKSQMWLLDPRPNLPKIVEMVERGFELSEASSTPVMLELRIRACHVQGSFKTKRNQAPEFSKKNFLEPGFRLQPHLPAAGNVRAGEAQDRRALARRRRVHQGQPAERVFPGEMSDIGILCQGGMYNA